MITKRQIALSVLATIITLTASQAEATRVGPQGPIGLTGATGLTGSAGVAGAIGATGATGAAGTNGSSFAYSMTCGVSGTDACKIGAVGPGGGWIFFVDYNDQYAGFDYLEVAASNVTGVAAWCDVTNASIWGNSVMTASQLWAFKRVGQGQANTVAMKNFCTNGIAYNATNYVSSPVKTDWFLPSLGELHLMFDNLLEAGVGGLSYNWYWSSSEVGSTSSWVMNFGTGAITSNSKVSNNYSARAIRAF